MAIRDNDNGQGLGGSSDSGMSAQGSNGSASSSSRRSNRGFASMDQGKQREIASKGGRAAHAKGTAHEFDSSEARDAGRKGGLAVSRNREHMAAIGRKGGEASHGRRGDTKSARSGQKNEEGD